MNEIIEKEETKVENMIYEIRDKQVMLDSEISRAKCHNYFYDMVITPHDIGESILVFDNYLEIRLELKIC